MTTTHDEQLAKIFGDAEALGYLDPKYGPGMHEQVLSLYIDMMLDLAAAQHEIEQLKVQRDATRAYLGVRLSADDVAPDDEEPIDTIKHILRKLLDELPDKKIQQIKEVRSSEALALAWAKLGGNNVATHTDWQGNERAGFGLKEAKDIIDALHQNGYVMVGRIKVTP